MPTKKLKAGERRSQNEINFEWELKQRKIPYEYEPNTFEILKSADGTLGVVPGTTYTPDYRLDINGQIIWIEVKGYARASDLLLSKIADTYFYKYGHKYLMVGSFGTQMTGTKGWYLYHNKRIITKLDNNIKKGIVIRKGDKLFSKKTGRPCVVPETLWERLQTIVG